MSRLRFRMRNVVWEDGGVVSGRPGRVRVRLVALTWDAVQGESGVEEQRNSHSR